MSNKRKIVSLFLFVYFALYSVSPLSFSFQTGQINEIQRSKAGLHVTNCSLVLLEILIDSLSQETGQDDFQPDNEETILVKKKRMLLSSADALKKAIKIYEYATINDTPILLEKTSYRPVISDNKINLHQGFHPLYSGTSPPSA